MIGLAEHMVMQNKNPLPLPEVQQKKLSWLKRCQARVIAPKENSKKQNVML